MKGYKPVCIDCGKETIPVQAQSTYTKTSQGREVKTIHIGRVSSCCNAPVQWEYQSQLKQNLKKVCQL